MHDDQKNDATTENSMKLRSVRHVAQLYSEAAKSQLWLSAIANDAIKSDVGRRKRYELAMTTYLSVSFHSTAGLVDQVG
jgi:hypothetical protein